MKPAERLAIPRQKTKELAPELRVRNFDEVVFNFDEATARLEADRCMQCKKPSCQEGCPLHNEIPKFIGLLREGKIEEAYWAIREQSSMPAVCSRVCPHEFQCEGHCVRAKKGEPVAIGMLERYIVDWMVLQAKEMTSSCARPNGKRVAIVGSGPAGMTVAFHLAHSGYDCTIFEGLSTLGGMLAVGIPAYRLPRHIIKAEFEALKNCGVEIVTGIRIGRDKTLAQLQEEGYAAVFLSPGAHASRKLGIEGEELGGVSHGVDYLRAVNLGQAMSLGRRVVVVGGGNVAIDVARTALRTGSDQVSIIYRRTIAEMPAAKAEIHHLQEEGVKIEFLVAPVRILGQHGRVKEIECQRMRLGECDASGRCRPVTIEGSNFMIEADSVIAAISQDVDLGASEGVEITTSRWGTYTVDEETLQTSVPWIFAGGDAVLGPQTAAKAVHQGKVAAESICRFIEGKDLKAGRTCVKATA